MMSLYLLSLLGLRNRTSVRAPDHPPQTSEKSEVFLLSEDILKAGNYDHPLQKYRKRKYIKPLYSLSTHAQSSMNPRHCEM